MQACAQATSCGAGALHDAGLGLRTVPLALFALLDPAVRGNRVDGAFAAAVGGVVAGCVELQWWARQARAQPGTDQRERERIHRPHTHFRPCDHPLWLLLEVENDLCIRAQQKLVADHMAAPTTPDGGPDGNMVTQLNMGEGKTAVIVPMLLAELADGTALARLFVLTSIFNTNFTQLRYKMGGLLGRRVVTLPFRRDMAVTAEDIARTAALVERCRVRRDVVVSVREHVLSMQDKYYEACSRRALDDDDENDDDDDDRHRGDKAKQHSADTEGVATALGALLQTLHRHARDIVDEADEVLHHRFQLIYPLGAARAPDGDHVRWETAQAVLHSLRTHAEALSRKFPSAVEFRVPEKLGAFPSVVRLVDCRDGSLPAACSALYELVFADVFGRKFQFSDQEVLDDLHRLSSTPGVPARVCRIVTRDECSEDDAAFLTTVATGRAAAVLLCLRGLLGQGVLRLALQKRYRVEFGVAPQFRGIPARGVTAHNTRAMLLAVPFVAKDIAKDNNEFGHTDLAVVLTLLSYYYDGLSDAQVQQVLDRLEHDVGKEGIFEGWMRENSATQTVDLHYTAVNGQDAQMLREKVYPAMRSNTAVVNYFLAKDVFPCYAKEFAHKILTNAWDLVPRGRRHIVTGAWGEY